MFLSTRLLLTQVLITCINICRVIIELFRAFFHINCTNPHEQFCVSCRVSIISQRACEPPWFTMICHFSNYCLNFCCDISRLLHLRCIALELIKCLYLSLILRVGTIIKFLDWLSCLLMKREHDLKFKKKDKWSWGPFFFLVYCFDVCISHLEWRLKGQE